MSDSATEISGSVVNVDRRPAPQEDTDALIQGLSPAEIQVLAQKVYDLLLDELRIEGERYGQRTLR